MYKTYDKVSNTQDNGFTGRTEAHQQKYGKLFYCYTKGLRGFNIFQDVKVHKAGWYLLRCNGFSTANSSENITKNGKPLANMFITVLDANTSTPLLAAVSGGQYNDPIQYGGRLDGIKQFEDEPELTDINGTK